ncbi:glycosyltransferase family 39 protein [Spirulina sp. CS-785/01]|uniref:ArnT family glycosyltransferase n=1 Tax=Spirulina sp. CS-785/01 TaxID=3021716 RepID=UPI0023312ED4|nr:glycosyltransferase family 39 protein [Spirulina sp. CS-785/01]MDB9315023.1 glycosyltransferase family 39 protein [Spirulina sp. CS-785/01]
MRRNWQLNETQWLILLTVAAMILWTIDLGGVPLRDWDEATHALVGRELYRTGDWLHLTFFGHPYFYKPPLSYWILASSYHLFGTVNEFTSRFPLALMTGLGVPLLYQLGKELFPQKPSPNPPALFSALVYLTLFPVVRHGRLTMLDGLVNTCFILLLLCLLRERRQRVWAVGIGLCLAAIMLTKGVLVLALWAIAGVFVLVNRQWKLFTNPYAWLGLVVGIALTGAWYGAQLQHYGQTFFEVHFQAQGFNRLSKAVEGNSGAPWYYLLELLKYAFPWLLFLPAGLLLAVKQRHTDWGRLVLIGTILFLGTITLMGTKLPWYILPYYPFFALTVGGYLGKLWEGKGRYSRFIAAFLGVMGVASGAAIVYFWYADRQWPLLLMGGVLGVTFGLASWQFWCKSRGFLPILVVGLYLGYGLLFLSSTWVWEVNEQFPVTEVGRLVREETPEDTVVYTSFAYNRPSLDFYSDRWVRPANQDQLQEYWESQHYLLLDQGTVDALNIPQSAILGKADGFILVYQSRDLEKGTGNRESGIGNRESGIGNRESGKGLEYFWLT